MVAIRETKAASCGLWCLSAYLLCFCYPQEGGDLIIAKSYHLRSQAGGGEEGDDLAALWTSCRCEAMRARSLLFRREDVSFFFCSFGTNLVSPSKIQGSKTFF
jgi:hypothetical protein